MLISPAGSPIPDTVLPYPRALEILQKGLNTDQIERYINELIDQAGAVRPDRGPARQFQTGRRLIIFGGLPPKTPRPLPFGRARSSHIRQIWRPFFLGIGPEGRYARMRPLWPFSGPSNFPYHGERRKLIVHHPQRENRPGAALLVGLLLGGGCLAAPEPHPSGHARPGGGDFVFGRAGPDPAGSAPRLPSCEGLGGPLFECTPRGRPGPSTRPPRPL